MKAPDDHKSYFGGFVPKCSRGPTWPDSMWLGLKKYGRWYEALISGTITPVSDEQMRFAALFRGESHREPEGIHENRWDAYRRRVEYERRPVPRGSSLSLRVEKSPDVPPRLPNGDDDHVYFTKRKRR